MSKVLSDEIFCPSKILSDKILSDKVFNKNWIDLCLIDGKVSNVFIAFRSRSLHAFDK